MHDNITGMSGTFRMIPTNIFSRRFLSAVEYPGPNTNRSKKCQATNGTSNDNTHFRWFLLWIVLMADPCRSAIWTRLDRCRGT